MQSAIFLKPFLILTLILILYPLDKEPLTYLVPLWRFVSLGLFVFGTVSLLGSPSAGGSLSVVFLGSLAYSSSGSFVLALKSVSTLTGVSLTITFPVPCVWIGPVSTLFSLNGSAPTVLTVFTPPALGFDIGVLVSCRSGCEFVCSWGLPFIGFAMLCCAVGFGGLLMVVSCPYFYLYFKFSRVAVALPFLFVALRFSRVNFASNLAFVIGPSLSWCLGDLLLAPDGSSSYGIV